MSLDGFINDRSGSVEVLYPDLAALPDTEPLRESIRKTGAVVMGRNSFAMAEDPDWYAGNYEYQVPIFVLTHNSPEKLPKQTDELTFTFITDGIQTAIRQAKVAAGRRMSPLLVLQALRGNAWRPGLPTNCRLISCRCFWVEGCGFLQILIGTYCNWND